MRILCWVGFHKWREIYRRLTWWDQRRSVDTVRWQCERCKKVWQFYDTGE